MQFFRKGEPFREKIHLIRTIMMGYRRFFRFLVITVLFWSGSTLVWSQNQKPNTPPPSTTRILFIFDASQSMYGRWQSDTKFNIAKKIMSEWLDSISVIPNVELALRLYGHQRTFPPQDCTDTKLEVPFAPGNASKIKAKLRAIEPRGTTPLAYALEQAANDFPPRENCRNVIVLITDGIEECGGDPCAVSTLLQSKGIILKPFIIAIGNDFNQAFGCVGTYFDATVESNFRHALQIVITQALNPTTAQVNLFDSKGIPNETDVAMTFYNALSGKAIYQFIHTLNYRGVPDTLMLDPLITYKLVVHTIPAITVDSIRIVSGKHNNINANAPQGYLLLKAGTNNQLRNIPCIVKQKGKSEILNVQQIGERKKYLTGKYQLELLTIPRLKVDSVEIKQSHTTTVEIPEPGIAVLRKQFQGVGSLLLFENNQYRLVYDLNEGLNQEVLYLQPGSYCAVFRLKNSKTTLFSIEKKFTIESGKTTDVSFF